MWAAVEHLDRRGFPADLKVLDGGPGRAAADPAVLRALRLYATSQGVTSARARWGVEQVAYLWLCGGGSVNYHSLSDFRVQHATALDDLMTQALGCLHQAGVGEFAQVAQDGGRVRASAGAASCRRQRILTESLAAAREALAAVAAADPAEAPERRTPRQQAARARAARERGRGFQARPRSRRDPRRRARRAWRPPGARDRAPPARMWRRRC